MTSARSVGAGPGRDAGARPVPERGRLTDAGDAVRTCVGCRARDYRPVLLRVVAAEVDGLWSVVPDPRRKLPGRGAWLHRDQACLDLAERRQAFARALRRSGPLDTVALREYVTDST